MSTTRLLLLVGLCAFGLCSPAAGQPETPALPAFWKGYLEAGIDRNVFAREREALKIVSVVAYRLPADATHEFGAEPHLDVGLSLVSASEGERLFLLPRSPEADATGRRRPLR